jgi:hypothetical protein
MPENQLPPSWGPAYDERDLDALLSGDTANLPDALLPLAGTLATLHARPVRAELAGEADARAAFRRFAQGAGSWTPGAEHGTVPHTLVLHRPQEDRAQRHTPRHRRRRAGGGLHRPLTIVGAAAGVMLVAGVAVAVLLPGSIKHLAHLGHTPSGATVAASGTGQASQAPDSRSATKEPPSPVIRPTPSNSGSPGTTTDPGTLCREYYGFFEHKEPKSAWAGEMAIWRKLETLAGSPWKVLSYCLPDVDFGSWGNHGPTVTPPHGSSPWPSATAGSPGNGSGGQAGTGTGNGSSGNGANGSSGNGSGPGQPSHGNPAVTTAPRPGVSNSQRQAPGSF